MGRSRMQSTRWNSPSLKIILSDSGMLWTVLIVTPIVVGLGYAALRDHEPAWLLHFGFGIASMVLLASIVRTMVRAAEADFGRFGETTSADDSGIMSDNATAKKVSLDPRQMRADSAFFHEASEHNRHMRRPHPQDVGTSSNNIDTIRRIER